MLRSESRYSKGILSLCYYTEYHFICTTTYRQFRVSFRTGVSPATKILGTDSNRNIQTSLLCNMVTTFWSHLINTISTDVSVRCGLSLAFPHMLHAWEERIPFTNVSPAYCILYMSERGTLPSSILFSQPH